ncbi:MAG: bifunctional diguanylate cyclase/phosphodiesterase [Actinobacteria bacterium]|nr:bifunctional diguanylate cyclase/phosphodiesterase [Actinomycetota bacterium]
MTVQLIKLLTELQFPLAGFAALAAVEQALVWRRGGWRESSPAFVLVSLGTAVAFFANAVALQGHISEARIDDWFFVRTVGLGIVVVAAFPLAAIVMGTRAPRSLMVAVSGVVAARIVLWPTTSLVYAHRVVGGTPVYGPLLTPTGALLIVGLFAYLCIAARWTSSGGERALLSGGIAGSLLFALVSLTLPGGLAAELLTGYVPFPALSAVAAVVRLREIDAFGRARRLAERQHTLAELGRMALTAGVAAVHEEARRIRHSTRGAEGEFAAAVDALVAAAAAQTQAQEDLHRRARTDDLTGLPNRTALRDLLDEELARAAEEGRRVAVGFIGIDRFRTINEVYGHGGGDVVLRAIGERLREISEPGDVVGRFSGVEFVVIRPDVAFDAAGFERQLVRAFQPELVAMGVELRLTCSVGTAIAKPGEARSAEDVLRDAHTAMYDAKVQGGAAIGRLRDGLRSAVRYRADLERRLAGALDRGEIEVHYQPVYRLGEYRIAGFEALARWRTDGEVIPCEAWIPVAESTGLIHDIGDFVLRAATAQLAQWLPLRPELWMSVNVSPRQLSSRRFARSVRAALAHGFDPKLLALEVTESLAVGEESAALLDDLRRTGVQIVIDDFGSGYSSLAALSRLNGDALKIDRGILAGTNTVEGRAVLAAVLALARSLDLPTVAEGVETVEQEQVLTTLGCGLVQGFLYQPPLPADRAGQLIGALAEVA